MIYLHLAGKKGLNNHLLHIEAVVI